MAGMSLAIIYALLLIPEPRPSTAGSAPGKSGAGKQPFVWNQDSFWAELEREFLAAKALEASVVSNQFALNLAETERLIRAIDERPRSPSDTALGTLETNLFRLAPLAGACTACVPQYAALINRSRAAIKRQSQHWEVTAPDTRETLYRLLFGGRMALEEVLVQVGEHTGIGPECEPVPSQTPATTIRGVTVHSGDILLSRGNAPTSSLIACGNDFPGNFSHAALLHVDEKTGVARVVEALIERGVVVTPLDEFVRETRLRLLVLRLRADLAGMANDPQLPHKAASAALRQAGERHIPYDFSMDFRDQRKQFCAEVVSSAYEGCGVRLWMALTSISSPTLVNWLSSLGVSHFETQEPSDLEYDPQLTVVAEWREPSAIFEAHLDDAVTDAMLAQAQPGRPLPYNPVKLPLARVVKAYSLGLNLFGKTGPIPEGLSATKALRVSGFRAAHAERKRNLAQAAARFRSTHNYVPTLRELFLTAKQP